MVHVHVWSSLSSYSGHKSQGRTLDKVLINIGKKEFFAGLTFVACSRVLDWVGNSQRLHGRLLEGTIHLLLERNTLPDLPITFNLSPPIPRIQLMDASWHVPQSNFTIINTRPLPLHRQRHSLITFNIWPPPLLKGDNDTPFQPSSHTHLDMNTPSTRIH